MAPPRSLHLNTPLPIDVPDALPVALTVTSIELDICTRLPHTLTATSGANHCFWSFLGCATLELVTGGAAAPAALLQLGNFFSLLDGSLTFFFVGVEDTDSVLQ